MKQLTVKLSVKGKPFQEYTINQPNNACKVCEARSCEMQDGTIDLKYWKHMVDTGTSYYCFSKKSIENVMILDMSDNPYQPGFCSGSVTENTEEARKELTKIASLSFCPGILTEAVPMYNDDNSDYYDAADDWGQIPANVTKSAKKLTPAMRLISAVCKKKQK